MNHPLKSASGSKRWSVGILGAGYIAEWHCRALRRLPGVSLSAVCDQSAVRAAALASAYKIPGVFGSLDELCAGPLPDAVQVLLPPDAHFAAAKRLLEAGAHVLLEKPMCLTPEECAELEAEAQRRGRIVAVSHNFLFSPVYERLRADLKGGELGRPDHVSITWHRELPALRSGPSGAFVLRDPLNILLEVAPHSVAHMLDLVGMPDALESRADDPVELPGGNRFYRRWLVQAQCGRTRVDLHFAFGPGFPEYAVHVRGAVGSATADFENNTYTRHRAAGLGPDFDRYAVVARAGRSQVRQARATLQNYVFAKMGLVRHGNPFGESIGRSLASFYASLPGAPDRRLASAFGREVVTVCRNIGAVAKMAPVETRTAPATSRPSGADVLVLGGTGFIGRALVRRLAESGQRVRILARDPGGLPHALQGLPLDVVRGDLGSDGLAQALEGVTCVYHLARSVTARTWDDYLRQDVQTTVAVAEECLRRGVSRLVYTGTIDSYYSGDRSEVITEATPLDRRIHRRNLYARSKAEAERLLLEMHRTRGLPVVLCRPGVVIGPGGNPYHWGVGYWPTPAVCRYWGAGDHPLPFVLADDVASGLALMGKVPDLAGQSFNLVGEPCLDARTYVAALAEATCTRIDARPCAAWRTHLADMGKWSVKCLVRHHDLRLPSYRDWQTRAHLARFDCANAKRMLGWSPRGGQELLLEEGVRAAAAEWLA